MDPWRNLHRAVDGWSTRTVAAILANPRYTGRQVWNRQRTDHDRPHGASRSGRGKVSRRNSADQWVVSQQVAHPALVSEGDFVAAQRVSAIPEPADAGRRYLLVGLLRCGHCGRRLHSHWLRGRAAYRCRHGATSAKAHQIRGSAKSLYLREDRILDRVRVHLGPELKGDPSPHAVAEHLRVHDLEVTCTAMACSVDTLNRHPVPENSIMPTSIIPTVA
jgi:hypothetical protein